MSDKTNLYEKGLEAAAQAIYEATIMLNNSDIQALPQAVIPWSSASQRDKDESLELAQAAIPAYLAQREEAGPEVVEKDGWWTCRGVKIERVD